jgi:hypothetical protein
MVTALFYYPVNEWKIGAGKKKGKGFMRYSASSSKTFNFACARIR